MTQQMPASPEQPLPPSYGAAPQTPAPARGTNTMAILALVFAFVFSPLGIVFGIIGRKQTARTGEGGRGLATAGLVLSIVFLVIGIATAVLVTVMAATLVSSVNNTAVAAQITAQSGGRVTDVSCPGSLPAQVGAELTCSGTVDGAPSQLKATVTSVDGGVVSFDFTQVG
ncbi:DUF4333 domain-containing protein [Actinomycetospora endophytica]|uniref:DUF4333 domain-containing protein n=1 Tax=Actinomycetospora endophytica TaxID=2291215 RepID=A0ABS8PD70_9PSEU|nr:DUF4333 domain-containing protein [Actinomycetospora endophytica]MCD2196225.1 DUF4333 domain-containing protein [Actinomycetospora endophytica]